MFVLIKEHTINHRLYGSLLRDGKVTRGRKISDSLLSTLLHRFLHLTRPLMRQRALCGAFDKLEQLQVGLSPWEPRRQCAFGEVQPLLAFPLMKRQSTQAAQPQYPQEPTSSPHPLHTLKFLPPPSVSRAFLVWAWLPPRLVPVTPLFAYTQLRCRELLSFTSELCAVLSLP